MDFPDPNYGTDKWNHPAAGVLERPQPDDLHFGCDWGWDKSVADGARLNDEQITARNEVGRGGGEEAMGGERMMQPR